MVVGCASVVVRSGFGGVTVARATPSGDTITQPMALPLPAAIAAEQPDNDPARLAPHRIKRCTYRRLMLDIGPASAIYEVECLFPDRKLPVPLGDLDSAMPVCNACTAAHIFRPDED